MQEANDTSYLVNVEDLGIKLQVSMAKSDVLCHRKGFLEVDDLLRSPNLIKIASCSLQ